MAEEVATEVELPSSTLTHRELRGLCLDNDLPISGNKSTLVERLLDAGVAWDDLGLPPESGEPLHEVIVEGAATTENDAASDGSDTSAVEEEPELVLEESEPMILVAEAIDEGGEPSAAFPLLEDADDEVLEAEAIEAEIVEAVPVSKSVRSAHPASSDLNLANLLRPRMGLALVVVALLIGAGSWYILSQPKAFTPDQLRYGDRMKFSISGGVLEIVGDEMVERIAEMLGAEDEMCGEIKLDFNGVGEVSVTLGDSSQIANQPTNQMLGAVQQSGPYGNIWLTAEKKLQYDFLEIDIETNQYLADRCNASMVGRLEDNQASIDVTSWTELRKKDLLKTRIDYTLHGGDLGAIDGTAVTYGFSSFGDVVQTILPGIAIAFAPVELSELLDGALLEEGASGERWSWNWTVAGIDEVSGREAWKIYVENEEVNDRCFGSAKINLWVVEGSPWPIKQYVDLRISNRDDSRGDCELSLLEQIGQTLLDFEMPQGSFSMQMTLLELESTSGGDLVDWKRDYAERPAAGQGYLSADFDWRNDGRHMPDLSSERDHTLEDAVECLNSTYPSSGLTTALDAGGYIWRAYDDRRDVTQTDWNLSWVDPADQSGWIIVEIWADGDGGSSCSIGPAGVYDADSVKYNRDAINPTASLAEIETHLLDADAFPLLSGPNGLVGMNGRLHNDASLGYLVITPTEDLADLLSLIGRDEGTVSVDIHRGWSGDGWEDTLDLLMDATDGRIIGWTKISRSE